MQILGVITDAGDCCRYSVLMVRPSGDVFAKLYVVGLNPTFATDIEPTMLNPDCPSMGPVIQCGFNERNCFGVDIFPLRIHLNPDHWSNPVESFPDFEEVFLSRHISNVLKFGGRVILALGKEVFQILLLGLQRVGLDSENSHLKVYVQKEHAYS